MKTLDFLIVILFILALVSGGFLGYSAMNAYQNSQKSNGQNVAQNTNGGNVQNPGQTAPVTCVDKDQDGYGMNCTQGNDCDDNDVNRNKECKQTSGSIEISSMTTTAKKDENITVTVDLAKLPVDINQSDILAKTVITAIDFDSNAIELVEYKSGSKFMIIEVDTPTGVRLDGTLANTSGQLETGAEFATLTFKAKTAGVTKIELSNQTRVAGVFEETGKSSISLTVQ